MNVSKPSAVPQNHFWQSQCVLIVRCRAYHQQSSSCPSTSYIAVSVCTCCLVNEYQDCNAHLGVGICHSEVPCHTCDQLPLQPACIQSSTKWILPSTAYHLHRQRQPNPPVQKPPWSASCIRTDMRITKIRGLKVQPWEIPDIWLCRAEVSPQSVTKKCLLRIIAPIM